MIEKFDPLKGEMLRILHPDGRLEESLRPDLSDETIRKLYRDMVIIRVMDQGPWPPAPGPDGDLCPRSAARKRPRWEAAYALGKGDWVFPSFRETGVLYMRGVPLKNIFLYWMGNEEGQKVPEDVKVFPISVPVGTHPLHAVGAAWAAKLQREKICTIAYFGDGATSEGDFHEAMNFAGVFQTPTIFFCQNNQYAISVSPEEADRLEDHRPEGHRLRIPGNPGGRQRPLRRLCGHAGSPGKSRLRAGPHLDRGGHLPLRSPHHGR